MPLIEFLNRKNQSKSKPTSATPNPIPVVAITGLLGSNIKTSLVKVSAKVVSSSGDLVYHIVLNKISDWHLSGSNLIINGVDGIESITLGFISQSEAEIGELRLTQLINGAILL
jgi:hypothetical protein